MEKARLKNLRRTLRRTIGIMFFLAGLCFASWASRIAYIQQDLQLSEAALGGVLFALPVGLMLSLPFSGWIIGKIGSRKLLITAIIAYGFALTMIGFAQTAFQLVSILIIFGFCSNAVNISVNTQAVIAERFYQKPIMGTFHGLWSLAGFCGAAIGALMTGLHISTQYHFIFIFCIIIVSVTFVARYLRNDSVKKDTNPVFVLPDKKLMMLGVIAFCSMVCEGTMFDWSVVYFKKIVQPDTSLIGVGYAAFMAAMATGRFVSDYFASKYGVAMMIQMSGILSAFGLVLAIIFPVFSVALLGFVLVGFGVSSVVPLVYSIAGKSKTMSPGLALAAVSTVGFSGFLIGPPLIGFIAEISNLKISFLFTSFMALCVFIIPFFTLKNE